MPNTIMRMVKFIDKNKQLPIIFNEYEGNNSKEIFFFRSVSTEKEIGYKFLSDAEKEQYVSDSAAMHMPRISVDRLYEIYNRRYTVSCDYEKTMEMISGCISITEANKKDLFALFLILHEIGHWYDFLKSERKPFLYHVDEKEYREASELKDKIIQKIDEKKMSDDAAMVLMCGWFDKYHAISAEQKADEYAKVHLAETYNKLVENRIIK